MAAENGSKLSWEVSTDDTGRTCPEVDMSNLLLLAKCAVQQAASEGIDLEWLHQQHNINMEESVENAQAVLPATPRSRRASLSVGYVHKIVSARPTRKRSIIESRCKGLGKGSFKESEGLNTATGLHPTSAFPEKAGDLNAKNTTPKLKASTVRRAKKVLNKAKAVKDAILGVSFYKRIGKWTAHIWASGAKSQSYLGSYFTVTEAARAYDKASLKFQATSARLNFAKATYQKDIAEMAGHTNREYVQFLQKTAKHSKLMKVNDGIHVCPNGWYEVRLRDPAPSKKWRFLGRFRNLQEAERCFNMQRTRNNE